MSGTLRVGAAIIPSDPYWAQVREAAFVRARELSLDLISLSLIDYPATLSQEEQMGLLEELLALELDALVAWALPDGLAHYILQFRVPVVLLSETDIRHPLLGSPSGPHNAVQIGACYLAEKTAGRGSILVVGNLIGPTRQGSDSGEGNGLCEVFGSYPKLATRHVPCPRGCEYEQAHEQIYGIIQEGDSPTDAIFGLSDVLAMAGRDVCLELDLAGPGTPVVGIGGTPASLAAIAEGSMAATVEIRPDGLGRQAIELAYRSSQGQPLPTHFEVESRLVTQRNVAEVTAQKLNAITNLYNRMMSSRRQQQQQRLTQLQTSLEISRRVGAILDHRQLSHEIANLIRANYSFDRVQILHWAEQEQRLVPDHPGQADRTGIPLAGSGVLGQALMRNEAIFIPDTQRSPRFSPDPDWPDTRTRVVLPIRLGGQVVGLLDLHSRQSTLSARQELVGLQSLADQLGIALSNADLYSEALQARVDAEKADRLKTRLLTNVSHELRTPLNTILGFVKPALDPSGPHGAELPAGLRSDLQHVDRSAKHLLWVINDLLDLSRAEIDELDLHLEIIEPRSFLQQVFHSLADAATSEGRVEWRLELPDRLPLIRVDPVRLRQILLNLLSNALKFTEKGQIVLAAEVAPPHLHIWVRDTGIGIPPDWQERIFEPFVTAEHARAKQRPEGIGLGLSITRRLVTLHRGSMTLESQRGVGSTFHVYLPLPSLSEQPTTPFPTSAQPVLLLVSAHSEPTAEIAAFSERQGLETRRLQAGENPDTVLETVMPVVIAWDLASATPADWTTVQRLRHHPQLCQAPFVLYGQEPGDDLEQQMGLIDLVTKPVSGETLLEAISALCPPRSVGPLLIVDDDPQALELYVGIVGKGLPGYPVRTAEDGTAALAAMSERTPCLVILDLMMPNMDGFDVLDWMRANQQTRRVPVLILSGQMLTFDNIKRLEKHALVTVQSKDILSEQETADTLYRILAGSDVLPPQTGTLVKRTVAYLQQNHDRPISRREIADAIGVSENHLTRTFRRELGITPWDYLNRYRIKQARELLARSHDSITSVALQVGFNDPAYFSRVFRKQVGLSPSEFREHPL